MKLSYYCASTSCGKINYIKVKSDYSRIFLVWSKKKSY